MRQLHEDGHGHHVRKLADRLDAGHVNRRQNHNTGLEHGTSASDDDDEHHDPRYDPPLAG